MGKDSRDDLILVKEKGKTRSHIYTYATGLPSLRLFLTRLIAISATKGKSRLSPGSPVTKKGKAPTSHNLYTIGKRCDSVISQHNVSESKAHFVKEVFHASAGLSVESCDLRLWNRARERHFG